MIRIILQILYYTIFNGFHIDLTFSSHLHFIFKAFLNNLNLNMINLYFTVKKEKKIFKVFNFVMMKFYKLNFIE
jgi:hypothetical protein